MTLLSFLCNFVGVCRKNQRRRKKLGSLNSAQSGGLPHMVLRICEKFGCWERIDFSLDLWVLYNIILYNIVNDLISNVLYSIENTKPTFAVHKGN